MAGKGGGACKVAYADFVTAMMAFFMVMWLISQNEKVKEAVAHHFRNETGKYAMGESLLKPKHPQLFKDHRPLIQHGYAPTPPEPDKKPAVKPYILSLYHGDRAMVGTAIVFDADAAELSDAARENLRNFVPLVRGKPQKLEIRGHSPRAACDDPMRL